MTFKATANTIYALRNISIFQETLNTPGWVQREQRDGGKKVKISGKVKVVYEEEKLKCLIILRAVSPCEYTLYLLTISPSLFCSARLIAPFNLCVCEMRGLGRTPAWLRGCALLVCCRKNKRWRLVRRIQYFVFREMRPGGLIRLATWVISPSLSEPFISISVEAAYLSANISEIPGLMTGGVRLIN